MLGFLVFLLVAACLIFICRFLAAHFVWINYFVILAVIVLTIIIGVSNGFWWGLLMFFVFYALARLFFGDISENIDECELRERRDAPVTKRNICRANRIQNFDDAVDDISKRCDRIYQLLVDEHLGFNRFLHLSKERKDKILSPIQQIITIPNKRFIYYSDIDGYYYGQLNNQGNPHGFGIYSYPWQEHTKLGETYTQINYFIGTFKDGHPVREEGVLYTFSNKDAHYEIDIKGDFRVVAGEGLYIYD